MYKIKITNRFKQSFKRLQKSGTNLKPLIEVINILVEGSTLPEKYRNHPLKGKFKGYYDCHVLPDLVLVYKIEKQCLLLILFDIGTHSNLFK